MDKPYEEDIEVESLSGISSTSKPRVSFKTSCLEHFRICILEGSKEMTTGGVLDRFVDGQWISQPVPNQREIFINSVEMLKTQLLPSIKTHSKFIGEKINSIDTRLKEIANKRDLHLKKLYDAYMKTSTTERPEGGSQRSSLLPKYNREQEVIKQRHELARFNIYRDLLDYLSLLLGRLGYFEEETG